MKLEIKHIALLLIVLPLCLSLLSACAQCEEEPPPIPTPGPGAGFMPDEPFGVTYASHYGRDNQVRRDPSVAKQIGVDWDRWPLPWGEAPALW